jgi:hypothetical protein
MKINLNQVYEGWRNNLFPPEQLKNIIRRVGYARMKECNNCEYNSKFHKTFRPDIHCLICECTLSAKTKCLSCSCPLDPPRWKEVVTDEQEEEMKL